jgi:threonylcarbamoyladenosine tRNA methylthiotransferase CDKAL1
MKKVFIDSVGCTENIIDGAIMKNIAISHGFESSTDPAEADLLIINTCAYKKHQEDLCLKAIKRYEEIKKIDAELVVCGCLVSINKERLDEIFSGYSFPPSDLIQIYNAVGAPAPDKIEEAHYIPRDISDSEMFRAREKIERIYSAKKYLKEKIRIDFLPNFDYFDYIGDDKTIFVRVSRGCLNNCGYCAIRYAQGKLHSVPVSSIIETISKGINNGYNRVFLIGTNTAHYGLDIGTNFFNLLEKVQEIDGDFQIIVHNYEPFGVHDDPEAFETLFSSKKMLSLYFPLQSGSQSVLQRMNRKYEIDTVIKSLRSLKERNKDVLVRTEFIIGYPGESWREFFETVSATKKFKFDQIDLHVFSSRPGTDAAALEGQVGVLTKYSRFLVISALVFFKTTIRKFRPV